MSPDGALTVLVLLSLLALWASVMAGSARRRQFSAELRRRFPRPQGAEIRGPASVALLLRIFSRRGGGPELLEPHALSEMSLQVAARLRAGAPVLTAWAKSWSDGKRTSFMGLEEDGAPVNLVRTLDTRGGRKGRKEAGVQLANGAVRALVGACRFSFRVGAPLAEVLEVIADSMEQATQALSAQKQAFTGPQLSATILTALPILVAAGGQVLGAGTVTWLLGSPLGHACLMLGLVFLGAGQVVSHRMIGRAQRQVEGQIEATLLCDLAASGLSSGNAIPMVLTSLGDAFELPELNRIAAELVMDAGWEEAWLGSPGEVKILHTALGPAWEDGVSPLRSLEHAAQSTRKEAVSNAQQAAAKLAVQLVLPLGVFLLPAFILLGAIPLVFTLLQGQLG